MRLIRFETIMVFAGLAGCASDAVTSDAHTPPTSGRLDVEAWLAAGSYKQWACETAPHASRNPSVHDFNRVCSNTLIAQNATATTAWPKGAASVKELYDAASPTTLVGYAVYLKTAADSANGASWYYYERVPLDSPAPHDANGVVADGDGNSGPAKEICVGCHMGAGKDAAHTPTPGSHDFVYTVVH